LGFPAKLDAQNVPGVIHLGNVQTKDIPLAISAADVLVQPGGCNEFNKYRFPCKLPMFFASGRPVILPRVNIGHHLDHGNNCLLLETGSCEELAVNIKILAANKDLRMRLGENGRRFAREHFSWQRNAEKVLDLYKRVLTNDTGY
jgi:glycosyltransferase involved in cell wall biosynthesis